MIQFDISKDIENPYTNTKYSFSFPDSDIYTKNTVYHISIFEQSQQTLRFSGIDTEEKLDLFPEDSDDIITNLAMRLSTSSLEEDWSSKEDQIWDTL